MYRHLPQSYLSPLFGMKWQWQLLTFLAFSEILIHTVITKMLKLSDKWKVAVGKGWRLIILVLLMLLFSTALYRVCIECFRLSSQEYFSISCFDLDIWFGEIQFGVLFWGFLFVCFLQNLINVLRPWIPCRANSVSIYSWVTGCKYFISFPKPKHECNWSDCMME